MNKSTTITDDNTNINVKLFLLDPLSVIVNKKSAFERSIVNIKRCKKIE